VENLTQIVSRWVVETRTFLENLRLEQRREQQKQLLMEQTLAAFRRKSMQEERRTGFVVWGYLFEIFRHVPVPAI